jgi:hypothetical protein
MIETNRASWALNVAQRSLRSASIFCTKDQTSSRKGFKKLYLATTRNSLPQKAKQATEAGDEAALVTAEVEEVDMAEDEEGTPALSTVSTLVT